MVRIEHISNGGAWFHNDDGTSKFVYKEALDEIKWLIDHMDEEAANEIRKELEEL